MSTYQADNKNTVAVDVTDHISAMLAYWDKDLVCRFANKAYLEWFGKTKEDMIDKIMLPELLGPAIFEKNLPYIKGALNGDTQFFEREIPTPNGLRYSLANYYPDIKDGTVNGFFVHVADVTPIKLLEKKLSESNEKIKEQNNRLMNFANIITHNLKSYANNLGIILDFFVAARTDDEKEKALHFLQEISSGFSGTIRHLTEIVEVKNLEKIKKENIQLTEYINQSIKVLKHDIDTCKATIHNNADPGIMFLANPAYMDSILLNLLSNALKYRSPDRAPEIEINALRKGNEIIFSVRDNGLGIDLEKHKKDLFGMYKTFHNNADAKGVGLYLVRTQVEAMGGTIDVDSAAATGTTFTIHFIDGVG